MTADASTAGREMVVTRVISAPRELVYDAWTDPKHIAEWWGPNGFTNTIHSMDVRPGGVWKFIMHGPDGVDYPNTITYIDLVRPERIEYFHGDGNPGDPGRFHSTVTLEDLGGKTRITLRAVFESVEGYSKAKEYGAVEGGNQTLARLEAFLTRSS